MKSSEIQSEPPRKRNTRNRILVAALTLINEQGESNTTTHQIADAIDISPGNLHYHFHTKSDLFTAILNAFMIDARVVLEPPGDDAISVDDFWLYLHMTLERLSVYRFLFRDFETIVSTYPQHKAKLSRFTVALTGNVAQYLLKLEQQGVLSTSRNDRLAIGRSLVIAILFSERFDAISSMSSTDSSLRAAQSALHLLLPYLHGDDAELVQNLVDNYC